MSVNNTETARTITVTDEVMDLLSLEDQAQMALHLGAEVSEAEVRDTISQAGCEKLFAHNNEEDENMTTETKTTEALLTLAGYSFLPRTKGDEKFVGKEMPLEKASKALLLDLIETQGVNIGEMESKLAAAQGIVTTRVVESALAQTQKKQEKPSRSLGQEKHDFFKWLGWFDLMNQGQINWLKTDNANMGNKPWLCIKYVRDGSTVKVSWSAEAYKGAQGDCAQIMDIWRALARQKGCKVWKNVQLHIVTK